MTFSNVFPFMKIVLFELNFTESCSQGFNKQYANTNSDNDLVPNRQQSIIWTNDGLVYWCSSALMSLQHLASGLLYERS